MPLIHNSPDPEPHKNPMWRGWQLPELRPSLQESLEHLRNGGLGKVHIKEVGEPIWSPILKRGDPHGT